MAAALEEFVYDENIGVDHVSRGELPDDFLPVMPEENLPGGQLHRITVNDVDFVLVRRGQQVFALVGPRAHLGWHASRGTLGGRHPALSLARPDLSA